MNIKVELKTNIADGSEVVFRSPADCSQVTGLLIYHTGGKTEFAFADAHGNNVGDIDHLFAENAVVKVILDVELSSTGQMIDDVRLAVEGKKPIRYLGHAGGVMPTVEEITEFAINALKEVK